MTRTSSHRLTAGRGPFSQTSAVVALATAAAILVGVAFFSPMALTVVLSNGVVAAAIVLGAGGLGLWLVRAMRLTDCPLRWRFLAAAGLGLGAMSLLVLALGVLGLLYRPIWIALLALFGLAGLERFSFERSVGHPWPTCDAGDSQSRHASPKGGRRYNRVQNALLEIAGLKARREDNTADDNAGWMIWLWLGAAGFGVLALLGGTMPPGTLWPEEGNGYDVLEYHLAAPREYLEAGQIRYLPHNVYSNFPFNVEMLYLLAMILHGGAVQAALTANLLNVFLGGLAVAGVWLAGREFGRGSGIVAGITTASCPLLTYLSGLAYVENGMLMFSALALAAVLRAYRLPGNRINRWCLLAGLFCGLACGCKYTAAAAVFVPLAISAAALGFRQRPVRLGPVVAFVVAAGAAFGPWLAKNALFTGNPIFPLAHGTFGEREGIWSDDCAARWQQGHLPAPEDRPARRRMARLWSEVLGSAMFGPAGVLAIAAGGVMYLAWTRPKRQPRVREGMRTPTISSSGLAGIGPCWLMIFVGLVAWLGWTHLVGRFAVWVIAPLAVILGSSWLLLGGNGLFNKPSGSRARANLSSDGTLAGASGRTAARMLAVVALIGVVVFNLRTTYGLFAREPGSFLALGAFGRVDFMTDGEWPAQQHVPKLNALLRNGGTVLMVGDAKRFYLDRGVDYCVVFNRNPFAEAAAGLAPVELLEWLRRRGYGYLYVDWAEMHRLRTSRYGFWSSINRELIDSLVSAGLRPIENFEIPGRKTPYATLFEILNSRR